MKLTKSLRAAIVKQFKDGARVEYLAKLYNQPLPRIEQVIRIEMVATEGEGSIRSNRSTGADASVQTVAGVARNSETI